MGVVKLYEHQRDAIHRLKPGSILCGGVGTGKSITALAYYYVYECFGDIQPNGRLTPPTKFKPLYIITTARKRDTGEWESECDRFGLRGRAVIDSWNNIKKYREVEGAFFIFDEQRVVGSGSWVKAFIRIARRNHWILLSATPGDTWMDYIPVFIANGFYRNRTEFLNRHAVYNRYSKYPKVDRFVETGRLEYLRRAITVNMAFDRETEAHWVNMQADYDKALYRTIMLSRWDPWKNAPIQDISGVCYLMRRVANSDPSRLEIVKKILGWHPKLIIFYNFDYELELLRGLSELCPVAEWNGHRHEPLPKGERWVYLVQYTAGAEGWNCVETDTIIFYSQNYSYKLMTQAAGRIDRMNTPFKQLHYYTLKSTAPIDVMIARALKSKRNFNERAFASKLEQSGFA